MFYFFLLFCLFAGTGTFLRFQTISFVVEPWGTLVVNIVGSLCIGFIAVYFKDSQFKVLLMVGLLGALTTFSSYALDLVKLFNQGQIQRAFLYFLLSNSLCFLGCLMGWRLGQTLGNSAI